jgi:hypothetical protein
LRCDAIGVPAAILLAKGIAAFLFSVLNQGVNVFGSPDRHARPDFDSSWEPAFTDSSPPCGFADGDQRRNRRGGFRVANNLREAIKTGWVGLHVSVLVQVVTNTF